jgi:hypothetical protein
MKIAVNTGGGDASARIPPTKELMVKLLLPICLPAHSVNCIFEDDNL